MGISPTILCGHVMHKRLLPKVNAFTYGIFYMGLPLSALHKMPLSIDHFGPISFYKSDHGARDGENLEKWARDILQQYDFAHYANGEITLVTMPRIMGYVFNPVSFWMCHDRNGQVRAVLCEVNNTFGETHTYFCANPDASPITRQDVLTGDKVFHVSPFLKREGHYQFRFDFTPDKNNFYIDYYDSNDQRKLITALTTKPIPLSKSNLRLVFWRYPLVTIKAIMLIHWQALKLVVKGIQYISKPLQNLRKLTATHNVKNL